MARTEKPYPRLRIGFLLRRVELYHPARLNALSGLADDEGHRLEVAELSNRVINHPVGVDRGSWRFSCKTLVEEKATGNDGGGRALGRALHDWLEALEPDALCIVGYSPAPMRSAARWASERSTATVLISTSTRRDRRRYLPLEMAKRWWVSRHYDAAFTAGARSAAYLRELGMPGDRIWRGCDVVDNQWWASCADRARASFACRTTQSPSGHFLYVGRLAPEKNLEVLLRAYAEYRNSAVDPWGLVVVGEGPTRAHLEDLARRLGLDEVTWKGYRQPDELPQLYAEADALVLPSTSEPWGLVVNEALACGLPVLVSESCGCVPELVYPGLSGYVFDPRDTGGLAELLCRVSAEPERLARMGTFGQRVVDRFTPETWARVLMDSILTSVRTDRDHG